MKKMLQAHNSQNNLSHPSNITLNTYKKLFGIAFDYF